MGLRRLLGAVAIGSVAIGLAVGCSCGPGSNEITLAIVEPQDGATLTRETDTNPSVDGVQANVVVDVLRLGVGETVTLVLDGTTSIGTGTVPPDGRITYIDVTFPGGTHQLEATARDGANRSPSVTIVVDDGCPTLSFVSPQVTGGVDSITLGPAEDQDGEACGATFETDVVVSTSAPTGTEVRLLVNGSPRRTAMVEGASVRFDNVGLDNRGAVANTLAVQLTGPVGDSCGATDLGVPLFVDCDGVSCAITAPSGASGFLNQSDDTSMSPGFQSDFEVSTDADAAGQTVRLVIDGDETGALSATAMANGGGALATFGNVTLAEGLRRVHAVCRDSAGNTTRSGPVEWTVDITPCTASFTAPTEGQLFIDSDDVDGTMDGIQIDASGTVAGAACTSFRTGLCSGVGTSSPLTGTSWADRITLGSSATQELCVEVEDEAGNVGEGRISVNVRTAAPQVAIETPTTGTNFNSLGTAGRTADLDPATRSCDIAFSVLCTEADQAVTLVRTDTMTMLAGGSAPCVVDGSATPPYVGHATFASVNVPSLNNGTTVEIVARHEADRLVGLSDPISIQPDCDAPTLTVSRPTCGSTLRPAQDENTSVPGLQYRVDIGNANSPKPPVDLELRDSGGTTVYGPVTSSTPATGVVTQFPGTPFMVGGDVQIHGCATDPAGNVGCNPTCTISVLDVPSLTVTQPTAGNTLSTADDCDGARSGLQIRIRATTDAASGSAATIQVGASSSSSTVGATGIDVCVDAADGRNVPIVVTVTDAVRGMAAAMIVVNIDTLPPTNAINDLVLTEADRRGGRARFTWTSVDDAGGLPLTRYEARCSNAAITSEALWSAATAVPIMTVPVGAGAVQTEDVRDQFRYGVPRYCVIRGADPTGALTPLPSAPPAPYQPSILTADVVGPAASQLGLLVVPVGDVDGDGADDVLVGGSGNVTLYFGSATGAPISNAAGRQVQFQSSGTGFGRGLAGIGNFNGDTLPDIAMSARGSNLVWIFYGRARASWTASYNLDVGCPASVCLVGTEAGTFFGWTLASAGDFNGDGFDDLAIGARGSQTNGRVFVLLGSGFAAGTSFNYPDTAPTPMDPASFAIAAPAGGFVFGSSVTTPGDFLGSDSRPDLVISAIGSTTPTTIEGHVYSVAGRAYPGAATGIVNIPGTEVAEIANGSAATFGLTISAIGDFNGDTRQDFAVYNGNSLGNATIFLQTASGFSSTSIVVIANNIAGNSGDLMGQSLGLGYHPQFGLLGDFDGDGLGDALLGSVQRGTAAGGVDLFYGANPAVNRQRSTVDAQLEPSDAGTTRFAAYVGDVNGDGHPDIMVGDPGYTSGQGRVRLVY